MGVKKRIHKLLEREVIKVSATLNTNLLNLKAALTLLELESAEFLDKMIRKFKDCPRIVHAFTTLAGYNLIVLTIAEDEETLKSESMENCSLRSQKGVRRSEVYLIGDLKISSYLPIREDLVKRSEKVAPCGVKCISCKRYSVQKCVGCPATEYYNG
ncbi:MAG: Lrp/AsnC family transcriptional regulator, partial [Candidatus Bathyarchaeia archaeon]